MMCSMWRHHCHKCVFESRKYDKENVASLLLTQGIVANLYMAAIAKEIHWNKSEIMKEIGDKEKENANLDTSAQQLFAEVLGTNKEQWHYDRPR